MPTYKLYYFNGRGGGEHIRFIFAQTGVQYEDVRFTQETWPEFKPKTPYGQMPVLEVDGNILAGSGPIARYLAEEYGLAGSNAFENAEIAGIVDEASDILFKVFAVSPFGEKDEARRAELKKELEEKHFPKYLGALEKRAQDNGSADGWIYGTKVTYVDLRLCVQLDFIEQLLPGTLDKYPAMKKLKSSVENLPAIAKWIKERPQTKF